MMIDDDDFFFLFGGTVTVNHFFIGSGKPLYFTAEKK